MKVGIIGLGRMGEGMSRRMIKEGIEVYGYRRNYVKAQEAVKSGYITDAADSLESLVQVVKSKKSIYGEKSGETVYVETQGIFQITCPEQKTEDTLDELLPLLEEGDIIIDHSTSDISKCQELELYCSKLGISYIFSGVYGATYAVNACSKIFQSLSPGNVE